MRIGRIRLFLAAVFGADDFATAAAVIIEEAEELRRDPFELGEKGGGSDERDGVEDVELVLLAVALAVAEVHKLQQFWVAGRPPRAAAFFAAAAAPAAPALPADTLASTLLLLPLPRVRRLIALLGIWVKAKESFKGDCIGLTSYEHLPASNQL
jgi:hypothetical protein